jgi:sugar phosphate isomerase/epimerase
MTAGISTFALGPRRLQPSWLDRVVRAGLSKVEVLCGRASFDYRDRAQISTLAGFFGAGCPLEFHSLHSPNHRDEEWGPASAKSAVDIAGLERIRRRDAVDEVKRAIEVAERAPFRYLIQHIGLPGEEFDERKFDAAFSSLEELNLFARHRGVEILLENIPNGLSSSGRLVQFVNATHLDNGFCFDTGHAHLMEGVERAYERMRDRIRSTHLHDNDGASDTHLLPGAEAGTIDWKRAVELLGSRPGQYPLVFEPGHGGNIADPAAAVARIAEGWEVA